MSRPIDLGEIYEQEFDPHTGRFLRLVPTEKRFPLDLDQFTVSHVRGKTRSGKTSLALTPFLYELAKGPGSVFVFDLAPEPANLFHAARAAKAAGKEFKFICLEPGAESFLFPPFQALPATERRNAVHLAQLLLGAFHADHGIVNQFFSMQGCAALLDAAIDFAGSSKEASAKELTQYLNEPESRKRYPHAEEIRMPIQFLAEYDQLASGDPTRQVLLDECIERGDVVYFYTSNLSGPLTARLVAGLGLFSLIHFARERTNRGKKPDVRIMVDEFQSLIGRQLSSVATESAKYGLKYVLANQSTTQLKSKDLDLSQIIFENSDLKIYFSSFGNDVEALQSLSLRNRIEKRRGMNHGHLLDATENESDDFVPFISEEAIKNASDTFGMAIIAVSDGKGHKEPFFVQMAHRYEKLDHRQLPRRAAATPTPTPPDPGPGPGRRIPLTDPTRQARHALIRQIIEAREAAERWR
jgi:TraM recognition site of TraD and TraG